MSQPRNQPATQSASHAISQPGHGHLGHALAITPGEIAPPVRGRSKPSVECFERFERGSFKPIDAKLAWNDFFGNLFGVSGVWLA
jgi:hypothetical protein